MIRKHKKILFVCFLVFLGYARILGGFFEQDEWSSFAYNFSIPAENIIQQSFAPTVGHYQPLNTLVLYSLISIFKINYLPYAIISIFLHVIAVALVYVLIERLFKNSNMAFMISLLFGISASTYQATTWVMADLGIHLSTIFAYLSMVFFIGFIDRKRIKYFIFSILALVISILFKETAVGLFVFLPIMFFIFADKKLIKEKAYPIIILGLGCLYIALRAIMLFLPSSYTGIALVFSSQTHFQTIYNVLSYPFKALSQSTVPSSVLISVAKGLGGFISNTVAGEPGTTKFDIFTQKYVLEVISFFVFASILSFCFFLFKKQKLYDKKIIISSFIFIFFNGLIYGFSPEKSGVITDLDSRNLYFISIATSLLIVSLIFKVDRISKNFKIIVFMLTIILNVFLLETKINSLLQMGDQRKMIVYGIKSEYPKLSERIIFYTESDKSFYGLPESEKILPFQSGFGQTLLVLYYESQEYSERMFDNRFLWEITDQGYREVDGKGFGYFRDFEMLKKTLLENNLPVESVIAYKYTSMADRLINITAEVRNKLVER